MYKTESEGRKRMEMSMKKEKIINVSEKRQITLPKKFFEFLNIGTQIQCVLEDNSIVLKPIDISEDFSDLILQDLIDEGYKGNRLVEEFKKRKSAIRSNVVNMMEEDISNYTSLEDMKKNL